MGIVTFLSLVILYSPIFMTILLSVYKTRRGQIQWDSFSTQAYIKLINEKQLINALLSSLYVGFFTVLFSLVIGFYFATYYNSTRGKQKHFLQFIIYLPFLLPPIITGLSLLIFLRELGIRRSLNTVIIGHTIFG